MKKVALFTLFAGLTFTFTACDKWLDTTNVRHQVGITNPADAMGYIYADQTVDSVSFYTFDTYKYYAWEKNPDKFISIDEKLSTTKIKNDFYVCNYFTLPVYFTPNTSDTARVGYVMVDSKSEVDDWSSTVYAIYCQTNWHRISRPSPKLTYNSDQSRVLNALHLMSDSAMQVTDTIAFYAYDNWTLTSANPDMIKPEVTSGKVGINKIPCTVAQNLTQDTIYTSLTLTSENGATTIIKFEQANKKEQKPEEASN